MTAALPFDVQFELLIWLTVALALVGVLIIIGLKLAWQRSLNRDKRGRLRKGVDEQDLWRVAGQRLGAKYDDQQHEQDEKDKSKDKDDEDDKGDDKDPGPPFDSDDGRRPPW